MKIALIKSVIPENFLFAPLGERKLIRNPIWLTLLNKRKWGSGSRVAPAMRLLAGMTSFLIFGLFSSQAHAQNAAPSLFFTPSEMQRIEAELQKSPPDKIARAKHLLHLGSILYFGPDNWTVWLQGEKWTPTTDRPNVHIIDVNENEVRLSVTLQAGRALQDIILRPHQSLNLLTGKVIEGF